MTTHALFIPHYSGVFKRHPLRSSRYPVTTRHVERRRKVHWARVLAHSTEGDDKKPKQENTTLSVGFGNKDSVDEWGTHAEPDKPTSMFPISKPCAQGDR